MTKIFLFSIILLIFALISSIFPDLYRLFTTPIGTTFPLIHNHPEDYFYYLSFMHQGYEGNWLITSRMTSENFPPYFVYTFFSLLGQLTRIIHLSLPWIYFLARLILGAALLSICLYIARITFKKNSHFILSVIFIFFGTGFWIIEKQSILFNPQLSVLPIKQFLSFWTHLDPIMRTTYLPHHLLSLILALLSLILLVKAISLNDYKKTIIAGLLALTSGFVFYSTMINILGGMVIAVGFILLKSVNNLNKGKTFLPHVIIYTLLSSLALIYLYFISHTTFPWTTYNNLSTQFMFHFPLWEYILAFGPLFLLTLLGLPIILSSQSIFLFILLGWVIFPLVGLFIITPLFPQYGNMMYLEATSYIPLGLLATYGIQTLEKLIRNRKLILIMYILLPLYFLPPIFSSIQKESYALPYFMYNRYIPNEVISSFSYLEENTPKESVILSGGFFGNIIPAFTHNRVVYGHGVDTYLPDKKHSEVDTFFSMKDTKFSEDLIKRYNVSYVYYSLDTDPPKDEFIISLNLIKIYANSKVQIYKIGKL